MASLLPLIHPTLLPSYLYLCQPVIEKLKQLSGSAIIYTDAKRGSVELASELTNAGIQAACYHAGMEKKERTEVQVTML